MENTWIEREPEEENPLSLDQLVMVQYSEQDRDDEAEILISEDVDWEDVVAYKLCDKKKPNECFFIIIHDPDTHEDDDMRNMLFISFEESDGSTYDRFGEELMAVVPPWFEDCDYLMECHWSIPKDMEVDQVRQSMLELGYTEKPQQDL